MINMRFIATTKEKVNEETIPIKDGQVIFSRDEQIIYLDSESKRTAFKQILDIDKEENRLATPALEGCFYYVKDSGLFYRYQDSEWVCLNSSEIIFDERNSFPEQGNETKLYVTEDSIYKWDNQQSDYVKVGTGNIMGELYWGSIK